jgi:hypothetical protein
MNILEFRNLINKVKNFSIITESNQYDKLIFFDKNIVNEIKEINPDIKNILNKYSFKSDNVFFKGGVARTALLSYVRNKNISNDIRDIDLVYIGEDYSDFHKLRGENLEEYSDMEYIETFEDYFKSRDITLNEVLINNNKLICTRRAFRDIENYLINAKTNDLSSRLLARMLLFAVRYDYDVIKNFKLYEAYPFDFLVCLLKAYELGIEFDYFDICKTYNITNNHSLSEWLYKLLNSVYDFSLFGRDKLIAKDLINFNEDKLNELYEFYPDLKQEVDKINLTEIDEDLLKKYLKKSNRNKFNKKNPF